jgi:N-acetylglucosaminyl-diphospho-decaprenol L-rhamnosyltransferase
MDIHAPVTDDAVAVVVVTYNSAGLLADLVSSLPRGLAGLAWRLIFVDNASSDASVETARLLAPGATIVETGRNGGYAAGINAGVAAAGSPSYILILNPDVRLDHGCVAALIAAVRRPNTGIAVPLLVDAKGDRIDSLRREPTIIRVVADAVLGARRAGRIWGLGEVVTDEEKYQTETVTDWAEGSTLLVSRECWARCGPWDESYFLYSEETDFALRARDAGLVTRYTPAARAQHLEGGSAQSPPLWRLLTINRLRLYRRRHDAVRAAVFWAVLLVRESTRAALGRPTARAAVRGLLSPRRLSERPGPHSTRM